MRDLSTEGNFRFKIDWASLKVGGKFTVFALICFTLYMYLRAISKYKPPGGLMFGGAIERFSALPFWGPCTWRGLFSEFYGIPR